MKIFIVTILLVAGSASLVFSDTIIFKDGAEAKGIIVEDYKDRIVISTYEGEKTFLKSGVRSIFYDLPEQNLIVLGDKHASRGDYSRAYFYYERAFKLNPDYELAREKMNFVTGYLFRRSQEEKKLAVQRRQELEKWPQAVDERDDPEALMWQDLGIRVNPQGKYVLVDEVRRKSPADMAGIRKDDKIVSVWGRFTGYMTIEEVAGVLLKETSGETRIAVARDININADNVNASYSEFLGGKLEMLFDGLTFVSQDNSDRTGLDNGDLVTHINGSPTRYMPLQEAINMIEKGKKTAITLTIQKDFTLWRK